MMATDTFTTECPDCGDPIDVVDGQEEAHDCPIPEPFRGRVAEASAESMRWTCEQSGHPRQRPDDGACICGTFARHVERGAVEIGCTVRALDEPTETT